MKKDYKEWMPKKAEINNKAHRPNRYKRKEIWLASVGENVGVEIDGKGEGFMRPVLILQNHNEFACQIIPLSTTERRGKYWHEFDGHTGKMSVALLSQIKNIDTARLIKKIGWVETETFKAIKNKIGDILGLKVSSPPEASKADPSPKPKDLDKTKENAASPSKIIHPPQSGGRQA
jgi:mRNA interferase MazF